MNFLFAGNNFLIVDNRVHAFRGLLTPTDIHTTNVPILLYHHLADEVADDSTTVTPETFENHIRALLDAGFTSISFEQLIAYVEKGEELPEKPVIITLDDGYYSNYEIAFPILKKYDTKATIFIIGVSVGKNFYKETNLPMIPHFSYWEAREMAASGLISIQSHSYDMHQYQPYETQPARDGVLPFEWESVEAYTQNFRLDYELSKNEIEHNIESPSVVYAYPFGKSNNLTDGILSTMGVKVTLLTNPANNTIIRGLTQSLYSLNRFNISNYMTPDEILSLIDSE